MPQIEHAGWPAPSAATKLCSTALSLVACGAAVDCWPKAAATSHIMAVAIMRFVVPIAKGSFFA
jgi:hypothetical protein